MCDYYWSNAWCLYWNTHVICYLDYDNVILTLVVLTAYLSVWMGRRCAGVVLGEFVLGISGAFSDIGVELALI